MHPTVMAMVAEARETELRRAARSRGHAGLTLAGEGDVVCCYARQDKHWVTGPDGQRWENYVVLADAHPELEGQATAGAAAPSTGGCCATETSSDGTDDGVACCS
jgi:hypothetical protein